MNKVSLILAVFLVAVLIALPLTYQSGKNAASTDLEAKYENLLTAMRQENTLALSKFEGELAQVKSDWETRNVAFKSHLRETLLNTGVTLEDLNAELEVEKAEVDLVNTHISQDTYGLLKTGMSYNDVIDILGREGENTLNMMDTDGTGTSSYVWVWENDEETIDKITATFIDQKLSNKHYSAFKL